MGSGVNFFLNGNIKGMKKKEFRIVTVKYPNDPAAARLLQGYSTRRKKSLLAVWYVLKRCSKSQDEEGYFDVPSSLLVKVRSNYNYYTKALKQAGLVEVRSRISTEFMPDYSKMDGLFDSDQKVTEIYSTFKKECKKYRFTYNPSFGYQTMRFEESWNPTDWQEITRKSLIKLGITDVWMKRDQFSRRLHHNLTAKVDSIEDVSKEKQNYKSYIRSNHPGKYSIVDATACQPTILSDVLGIIDKEYIKAINSSDFYNYLKGALGLKSRNAAKKAFNQWAMHTTFIDSPLNKLFPKMTRAKLKRIKAGDGKGVSKKLQRMESRLFIDECLNNIEKDLGIDFSLTIHDSFIVENKDVHKVKKYLEQKTPFNFTIEKM